MKEHEREKLRRTAAWLFGYAGEQLRNEFFAILVAQMAETDDHEIAKVLHHVIAELVPDLRILGKLDLVAKAFDDACSFLISEITATINGD